VGKVRPLSEKLYHFLVGTVPETGMEKIDAGVLVEVLSQDSISKTKNYPVGKLQLGWLGAGLKPTWFPRICNVNN